MDPQAHDARAERIRGVHAPVRACSDDARAAGDGGGGPGARDGGATKGWGDVCGYCREEKEHGGEGRQVDGRAAGESTDARCVSLQNRLYQ